MPYGPDEHGFITEAENIEQAGHGVTLHPDEPEAVEARAEGAARVHDRLWRSYMAAGATPTGADITCPQCGKRTRKSHPLKRFCSNARTKGKRNCKDRFWNRLRGLRDAMEAA